MHDAQRFNELQSQYRDRWDAYQIAAYKNAAIRHEGEQPSDEELRSEQRAARAVAKARDALLAAASSIEESVNAAA